jgi:hypothetical protein
MCPDQNLKSAFCRSEEEYLGPFNVDLPLDQSYILCSYTTLVTIPCTV